MADRTQTTGGRVPPDLETQLDSLLAELSQLEPNLIPKPQPGESHDAAAGQVQVPSSPGQADKDGPSTATAVQTSQTAAPPTAMAMAAPTEKQAPVEPASAPQAPQDLSQRIDALLQEQATETSDIKAGPAAVPIAAPQQQAAPPAPAHEAEPVVALSGEVSLASQIDALFQQMQGSEPSTPPLPDPLGAREDKAAPAGAAPAQASAVAPPEKDETALTVEEIDRLLAEQADRQLAKELGHAAGAQVGTAEVAKAPPARTPDGGDPSRRDEADPLAGLAALTGAGARQVYVSDEGVRTTHPPPRGATAADVAKELDQQPEHPTRAVAVTATGKESLPPTSPGAEDDSFNQPAPIEPSTKTLKQRVRGVFLRLNRPLERFSPATRDTIGYFALLHLFVGSVLIFAKVLGII